jgi:beta-glucoside operon transcriptional antiterminator
MCVINTRKCNNNIILAEDKGQEVIVLGKGIGFNSRIGDPVDMNLVEKIFVPQENVQIGPFQDILAELPYECILLADKIVQYGKEQLKRPLNQSIAIALADHLNYVFVRLRDQLHIHMPLAWDIQRIYPVEFNLGKESLRIITDETGVVLPDGEAAAIALHFINAELDYGTMPDTIKITKIINKAVEIIESHYKTVLNETTPDFNGFVTLLRSTIIRFLYHPDEKQAEEDKALYGLLQKRYSFEFACAEKLAAFIEKEYNWQLTQNDISFLTLYISRITANTNT